MQTITQQIRAAFEAQDINQTEAARRLDVTPTTVGSWLSGRHAPFDHHRRRIEKRFGLPTKSLGRHADDKKAG